jgi:RNA polymerase sigma-32 factor
MREAIKTSDARIFVKSYQPLLDKDSEKKLFRAWWDSNPEASTAFFDPENTDVKRFCGGDDETYLTRIIVSYGPIIRRAIKELAGYKMPEDELLSEGLIALAEAARRYIPASHEGTRFSAYAKVCVKGMMQGYIMKNFFFVHMCTNHTKKKLFYSLRKLIAIELHKHGQFKLTPAVTKELAENHKLTEHDVVQMYVMFQNPYFSLDAPRQHDGNNASREENGWTNTGGSRSSTLGELLYNKESNTEDMVLNADEIEFHKRIVENAMTNVLTDREQTIFVAQVLAIDKDEQRTLDNLGEQYGVSKERIRQLRILAEKKVDEEIIRIVDEMELVPRDLFSG